MANKKLKKVSGGGLATTLVKTGEIETTHVQQHKLPVSISGTAKNLNVVQNYKGTIPEELQNRINENN